MHVFLSTGADIRPAGGAFCIGYSRKNEKNGRSGCTKHLLRPLFCEENVFEFETAETA